MASGEPPAPDGRARIPSSHAAERDTCDRDVIGELKKRVVAARRVGGAKTAGVDPQRPKRDEEPGIAASQSDMSVPMEFRRTRAGLSSAPSSFQ